MKTDSELWREIAEEIDRDEKISFVVATNFATLAQMNSGTYQYHQWIRMMRQLNDAFKPTPSERQSRVIACLLLSEIIK